MKSILRKIFYYIWKIIKIILLIIILITISQNIIAPVYKFPQPTIFKGNKIWNPYQNLDSSNWFKCVFHLHSKSWGGLTSGKNSSPEVIHRIYKSLGYDLTCISNYQKIDDYGENDPSYIPCYEHGYGIQKSHHVCIGAKKITWLDFLSYQTIHQRQYVLNELRKNTDVVAIAHPKFQRGFSVEQMKYLTNYNCVEVLNHFRISDAYWDTALSAGHPVYILADDDSHDIYNSNEVGHFFTMVRADTLNRRGVVNALKNGHSYGVVFSQIPDESYTNLAVRLKKIARLIHVIVQNDTLKVQVSNAAQKFDFVGQNGKILKTVALSKNAFYKIIPEDSYVRTVITFEDSTKFYLNPVFRITSEKPDYSKVAEVDMIKTIILRIVLISIILGFVIFYFKRKKLR